MTGHRVLVVACLALLVAAPVGLAQPPKPGPEFDILKKLEGTWDAVIKFGGQESKGTMTYKLGPGGRWMVSEFQGDFGGEKFEGKGLDGYNPLKKKYVSVWIDSMSPSPLVTEGTYDADTKTVTMEGEGPGQDGKPVKHKTVSTWKDDDTIVFTVSQGGDEAMLTITYKRRK
jgi:hypothetical protein